jgi:signal transduction histidine kinase/CheY-like chemotaxis protein
VNGFETKLGDVFPDLFIPEQRPVMRELMSRALSGERFTVVEEFGRPELGRPYWELNYTPLRDETGTIIGAFHHAKDLSSRLHAEAELAQAQEALRQSQKLESMGQLTGGVAHDFNNLLTPIIGSLDMLVRKGLGSERERRLIDGALQSAERAKTLVQRLLAFARRQPLQPSAVDLPRLITEMAGLIGSTLGPNIDVQVKLGTDMPPANADPNQLEMALLNLAVNARDAMPDGGVLTIKAKRESVDAHHRTGLRPGEYVVLCVTDTGTGMDEETRARAIEPFFSTKGIGKGTGLGLSMVHGLAGQLGGTLMIDSVLGEGTTIELWLPVSHALLDVEDAQTMSPKQRQRRGKALLVDDEELVRMSTADMLIDLGFDVIEAASGEEALRITHGAASPAVLVTDHLMPGMSGADLARTLRASIPDLPVLIVSGYAEAEGLSPEFPRLTKPFRSAELAASLAAMLPGGAE